MWQVYLSGEIHTDWREQIIRGAEKLNLPVQFSSAVTHHDASDAAGDVLGKETDQFWRDHKSAKVNAILIKTQIEQCDLAIIRFGGKYKQWNAAFDAGYCAALGTPTMKIYSPIEGGGWQRNGLGAIDGSGGGNSSLSNQRSVALRFYLWICDFSFAFFLVRTKHQVLP